ncbi:MAG: fluoride efflux transporter CrcB [Anaerolineales bacterium]
MNILRKAFLQTILFKVRRLLRRAIRNEAMEKFLIISIGAMLGANARYWLGGWAAEKFGAAFPYGTLIINLTGSFLLGLFITFITDRFLVSPNIRLLIAIGFFGSYTTFSSYTFESMSMILENQWLSGLFNLFGSAFLGGLAVLLGVLLARVI